MRVTRAGPSEDLSALSYPLVAHPLYPECGRTGPVQGRLGNLAILLEVIPEHRRPLSRLDGHAQVGEGCEASDRDRREIEHHCGNPAAAVTVGNSSEAESTYFPPRHRHSRYVKEGCPVDKDQCEAESDRLSHTSLESRAQLLSASYRFCHQC